MNFLIKSFDENPKVNTEKRKKTVLFYYKSLVPTLYTSFFGILGYIRYFIFQIVGLFRPIYRQFYWIFVLDVLMLGYMNAEALEKTED